MANGCVASRDENESRSMRSMADVARMKPNRDTRGVASFQSRAGVERK